MIPRISRPLAIIIVLCLAAAGWVLHQRSSSINSLSINKWRRHSSDFAEQVKTLGKILPPGGGGVVRLTVAEADELILLPTYMRVEDLNRSLPGRPADFVEMLSDLSLTNRAGAFLVWMKAGQTLSINPVKFSTAMNLPLRAWSWSLRGDCEIHVTKEMQSPNTFLSIEFEDKRKP